MNPNAKPKPKPEPSYTLLLHYCRELVSAFDSHRAVEDVEIFRAESFINDIRKELASIEKARKK